MGRIAMSESTLVYFFLDEDKKTHLILVHKNKNVSYMRIVTCTFVGQASISGQLQHLALFLITFILECFILENAYKIWVPFADAPIVGDQHHQICIWHNLGTPRPSAIFHTEKNHKIHYLNLNVK